MRRLYLLLFFICFQANAQIVPSLPAKTDDGLGEQAFDIGMLQVKPEYDEGMDAFYKFVGTNFRVPELNFESDFTAKIYTSFVIEKDGTVSNIKIIKDAGFGLGKEAERLIKLTSGKWSPGMKDGKPVRAAYSLPFAINIKGTGPKKPVDNTTDDEE